MPEVMNPYTFVPFGAEPDRQSYDLYYGNGAELLSGWLDVKLTTKTRTIIPDGAALPDRENKDKDAHTRMSLFRVNGVPVIPGSELRGMLRSVYEAVSNSCVPFLLDDKQKSMRVPLYAALKNRGLLMLENGKWTLWKAEDEWIKAAGDATKYGKYQNHSCGDWLPEKKAWIQFSTPVNKSKPYSIHYLRPAGDGPLHVWQDDEPYRALCNELTGLDMLDPYVKDTDGEAKKNPSHTGLWENAKKVRQQGKGAVPVWYQVVDSPDSGKRTYVISASSVGQVNQVKRWTDIMMKYNPCAEKTELCPACMLFGNVVDKGQTEKSLNAFGKKKTAPEDNLQVRTRLRFTDALPEDGKLKKETKSIMLPILSGPRPTAFEFYLKKPTDSAKFWNYDLYSLILPNGKRTKPDYHPNTGMSPRGRKFYWHGTEQTGQKESNQNATCEAMEAGETFTFRVYFDGITPQQLSGIRWVITFGENSTDSTLQHKLGHGKPAGYGSVKLNVTGETLRRVTRADGELRYSLEPRDVPQEYPCPFRDSPARKALMAVADTRSTMGKYVCYPHENDGANGLTIYKWFANNRGSASGLKQTLPEAAERKGVEATPPPHISRVPGSVYTGPLKTPVADRSQPSAPPVPAILIGKVVRQLTPKVSCLAVADGKEYTVTTEGKWMNPGQTIRFRPTSADSGVRIG